MKPDVKVQIFDILIKFFNELDRKILYNIFLKDRGGAYCWHVFQDFVNQLPLKKMYKSFIIDEFSSEKPVLYGSKISTVTHPWLDLYWIAKDAQKREGTSFERAYINAAKTFIPHILSGRKKLEEFLLEARSKEEFRLEEEVLKKIVKLTTKPKRDKRPDYDLLVSTIKTVDEMEIATMRTKFIEEEKRKILSDKRYISPSELEKLAAERVEKRLQEWIRRRRAEKSGKIRDIIWRLENQLFSVPIAEWPLHREGVYYHIDKRSNCIHMLVPLNEKELYSLTIHWSDREALNSKSRFEGHLKAAVRSLCSFLVKRPFGKGRRRIRSEIKDEKVVDSTFIFIGNYSRKLQKRGKNGVLVPKIYKGYELALVDDRPYKSKLEDMRSLAVYIAIDDIDLRDIFLKIAEYFRRRLTSLESSVDGKSCYGVVHTMKVRFGICIDFFKTLSECSWDSLRPPVSLIYGHARKVNKFKLKLRS